MLKYIKLKFWIPLFLLLLLQKIVVDLDVVGECWTLGPLDGRHFAALGKLLQPVVFLLIAVVLSGSSIRLWGEKLSIKGLRVDVKNWFFPVLLIIVLVVPAIYLANSKYHRVDRRMNQPLMAELALARCIERGVDIQQWGIANLR